MLNSATRFWLVGAKPSLADIASVKAALAGVTIGMAPGVGGRPTRRFVGLQEPPVVTPGTKGTSYVLISHVLGPIRPGATVLYHGQEIGKVTSARFTGVDAFRLGIFVYQPYDALVRSDAMFWTSSPLQVSLTGAGLSTNFAPADTVLSGGVDFDLPDSAEHQRPSAAGSTFVLYKTQGDAQQRLDGPQVLYSLVFKGAAAGDLNDGSAVKLGGFQIGQVQQVDLRFDASGEPYTVVGAAIYPQRLGIPQYAPTDVPVPRGPADARLDRLLARGYRAGSPSPRR